LTNSPYFISNTVVAEAGGVEPHPTSLPNRLRIKQRLARPASTFLPPPD